MKKLIFLSGSERYDKPQLVLSILLSVIFFSGPLSGLFNPCMVLNVTERHYHDNPQGFFTFFALLPDKEIREDTIQDKCNTSEVNEPSIDTTSKDPLLIKNSNILIW